MTKRSEALAQRVEEGHRELMALIESLSDEEWKRPIPGDMRTVGVVLHHVADVLPILTVLFKDIAAGNTMTGLELQEAEAHIELGSLLSAPKMRLWRC